MSASCLFLRVNGNSKKLIISSYDDFFSIFFCACELPSCGLFFSFRLAYLYNFKSYDLFANVIIFL